MEPAEHDTSAAGEDQRQHIVDSRMEKQVVCRSTRIKKKSVRRLEFEESHNAEEMALVSEL
ncbi:hypothetical protein GN244_ATG15901 [Phytophthora infestans]|uniref:Uncharacterized protein n=1 Tax=Phytophthora infestans TaxID=4787 RepID=A0A833SIU1_PHYIN|nr:hypothetical protein GN244_ATG15901 [Phytophthora infestans]